MPRESKLISDQPYRNDEHDNRQPHGSRRYRRIVAGVRVNRVSRCLAGDKPLALGATCHEHGVVRGGALTTAMSVQDVMAKFAWLVPAVVEDALREEADALDLSGGISAEDRARRRQELRARIDAAERAEEQTICDAEARGIDLARRADASPLAVLAMRIVGVEARAA